MRRFAISLLCILTLHAAWECGPACAQRDDPPQNPTAARQQAGKQDGNQNGNQNGDENSRNATSDGSDTNNNNSSDAEVRPSVYYLRDNNGKLQAVFGFPYEEFRELYDLKKQLSRAREPSRFLLKQASITGTVSRSRADLSVTLSITTRDDRWVRVPMGFGDAALYEPATYQGPGKLLVEYVSPAVGYVAWIRGAAGEKPGAKGEKPSAVGGKPSAAGGKPSAAGGKPSAVGGKQPAADQQHSITLRLAASVVEIGDRRRLALSAPRTTTASRLVLQLPIPDARISVADGAHLLSQQTQQDKTTEVTILGVGPTFSILWGEAARTAGPSRRVITAVAALRVVIDSRGVQTDAHLTVDNRTGTIESFQVRLPEGARLDTSMPQPGYELLADINNDPRLVEVKLAKPSASAVEVRLTTRRPRDVNRADEVINLAGFEVIGAARQGGHLAVVVDGDWRIGWVDRRGVMEVDQLPEVLRGDQQRPVAGFEYFRNGYTLSLRVAAQETHVAVEPNYLVTVESDRLSLIAQLSYNVRGAKVSEFDVQMPGWQIDKIEPAEAVGSEAELKNTGEVISIPLAQRLRAPVVLTVFAHQKIESGAKEVRFFLPHPVVDSLGPATVIVQLADNVALIPRVDEIKGLVARRTSPSEVFADRLKGSQQQALAYRNGNDDGPARFVADFHIQKQQITASISNEIHLSTDGGYVEQTFSYHVAHQMADGLVLVVPTPLAERSDVSFRVGGKEVVPVIAAEATQAGVKTEGARTSSEANTPAPDKTTDGRPSKRVEKSLRMLVSLPTATLGPVQISLRYPLPAIKPNATAKRPSRLWLASVDEKNLTQTHTLLIPDEMVRVRLDDARWTATLRPASRRPDLSIQASVSGPCLSIQLKIERLPRHTTVDLAWIQSWLAGAARQNFSAYRFHTNDDRFRLRLPAGVSSRKTIFWLDGRQVGPTEIEGTRDIFIALAEASRSGGDTTVRKGSSAVRRYVVEVLYSGPVSSEQRALSVDAPKVIGDATVLKTIWQLALPGDRQLISDPQGFTPEFTWGWRPVVYWGARPILFYWGRQAAIDHRRLREISGARNVSELPRRCNQIIFSTLGSASRLRGTTASHSMILLTASAVVLAFGLMLIYLPASRRPGVLLALAVGLAGAGMMVPAAALLVAQAGSVGLALAILGGLIERLVAVRRASRESFHGSSSPVIGSTRTEIMRPRETGSSRATTLSVPQVAEAQTADSKP